MEIEVIQLENQLMKSNCFILADKSAGACVIIDPASEKAEREIDYIEKNILHLDYIILTHIHADHCWGVNTLRRQYPEVKVIAADDKYSKREIMLFFRMWHEDLNYTYKMEPAEIQINEDGKMDWVGHEIKFVLTPGHSLGSMCLDVDGMLFTGDTLMPFPPYFNGRGSNKSEWKGSVAKICNLYNPETKIYPGHGEVLTLGEWKENKKYSNCK